MIRAIFRETKENKFYLLFTLNFLIQIFNYSYSFITAYFFKERFTVPRLTLFVALLFSFYLLQSLAENGKQIAHERMTKVYQRKLRRKSLQIILALPVEKIITLGLQYIKTIVEDANNQMYSIMTQYLSQIMNVIIGAVLLMGSLYVQSPWLALFSACIVALTIGIHHGMSKKKLVLAREYWEETSKFKAAYNDILNNAITIKKLGAAEYFFNTIDQKVIAADQKGTRKVLYDIRTQYVFDGLTYLMLLAIFIQIGYNIYTDPAYNGLFWVVFYLGIFSQVRNQISSITRLMQNMIDMQVSLKRFDSLMHTCAQEKQEAPPNEWSTIAIRSLQFKYESSGKGITVKQFKIMRGEHISLMGESGSGKTTFLSIINRQLEAPGCCIELDGMPVETIPPSEYISQSMNLFNDTLINNLCLGREIPMEMLDTIFADAGLLEWVNSLPDRYGTMISENASNLSDGQKMRLKLIRGILRDSAIYLLDEPGSNLDTESIERIIRMISKYLSEKTVLISTHDPCIAQICDRHYSMDKSGNLTENKHFLNTVGVNWVYTGYKQSEEV